MVQLLRTVCTILLLFFLPGYVSVWAIFPRREDVDSLERVGLGISLSIVLSTSLAMLLNVTPWGVQEGPMVVAVVLLGAIAGGIFLYRRRGIEEAKADEAPHTGVVTDRWRVTLRAKMLIPIILSMLTVMILVFWSVAPKLVSGESYSQFYVLAQATPGEYYPTTIALGEPLVLVIGVSNHEKQAMMYRIVESIGDLSATQIVDGLLLQPGETWEHPYARVFQQPGEDIRIEYTLFRDGAAEAYRSIHIWVNVR